MALKTFILKNSESRKECLDAARNAVSEFLKSPELTLSVDGSGAITVENCEKKVFVSLTCANDIMLVVLCDKPVGIDGEYLPRIMSGDNKIDYVMLSERFFSLEEAEYVHDTANGLEAENFVKIWVRKEAYCKASGKPISEFPNFSVIDNNKFVSKIKGIGIKIFKIAFDGCDDYLFAIALSEK